MALRPARAAERWRCACCSRRSKRSRRRQSSRLSGVSTLDPADGDVRSSSTAGSSSDHARRDRGPRSSETVPDGGAAAERRGAGRGGRQRPARHLAPRHRARRRAGWRIVAAVTLSVVEGLYRLTLDETAQYPRAATSWSRPRISSCGSPTATCSSRTAGGGHSGRAAGQGRDDLHRRPRGRTAPDRPADRRTERCGQSFDAAMIRLNPGDQATRLPADQLIAVTGRSRGLRPRARGVRRGGRQVVQRRPGRSQPRDRGRCSRRSATSCRSAHAAGTAR